MRVLSFLDAYSGYHQIKLDPADEAAFKPSKETNKVKLNPEDPSCSKYVVVGTRLDNK